MNCLLILSTPPQNISTGVADKQVTTGPVVELEDGSEEEHKILEGDPNEIRELLQWILAL